MEGHMNAHPGFGGVVLLRRPASEEANMRPGVERLKLTVLACTESFLSSKPSKRGECCFTWSLGTKVTRTSYEVGADYASGTMPVVYQGQGGASLDPTSGTSTYIFSTSRSSSYSWFALSSPWLCGAVLIVAVLLYHHRRGKGKGSRGVSMSQAETPVSTNSPKQSQWSADDNSRSEKEAFSTSSSSWSPSVVKHGHHASGTPITTAVKTIFPYPAPPSPTLSPMADEDENRDFQDLESQVSPSALTSSTSQAGTREPPRRRSYTKSSLIPLSPQSTISMSSTREISPPGPERASTFPITADSSEFEFGTGADPLPMGIELNEEIIIAAEGWRRHTRVYGGGVCLACVESEQQADKMGIKLAEMDA